jgi:hypothetical protein
MAKKLISIISTSGKTKDQIKKDATAALKKFTVATNKPKSQLYGNRKETKA